MYYGEDYSYLKIASLIFKLVNYRFVLFLQEWCLICIKKQILFFRQFSDMFFWLQADIRHKKLPNPFPVSQFQNHLPN